jgi:hypothetical protein
VAYFTAHVAQCVGPIQDVYACEDPVSLATLHQTALHAPANDDWQDATPISGDSFARMVDTSHASYDGLPPIPAGDCFLSQIDPQYLGNVWFRYTPSFTGHVNVSARSSKPGLWSWPIMAELGSSGPIPPAPSDTYDCVGSNEVVAGHTYLIAVGGFYDPYYGEQDGIGGQVYLTVGQADAQRPVRDLTATVDPAAKSATASWRAPFDGLSVTGYRVSRSSQSGSWSTTLGADATSFTFPNLKGWEPYTLTVEPIGPSGTPSPDAPRSTVFAYLSQAQPSAPLHVRARISGVQRIRVTWREPAFRGEHAISGYRVRRFSATGTTAQRTWTVPASARSYVATGLAFRRGYRFDVTAINASGRGRVSLKTSALTLTGIPTAPVGVKVKKHTKARTATLSWSPPANTRGGKITGYIVHRNSTNSHGTGPRSTKVGASVRSHLFKYLVLGRTYSLSVRAITAQGRGPWVTVTVKLPKS